MRKVAGIESVEVSLQRAVTEIRLKPGNNVTMAQLRKIIKDGGFSSGTADVDVIGTLVQRDGRPALLVSGTSESFPLVSDPRSPDAFRWVTEAAGKPAGPVILSGRIETNGTFVVGKGSPAR